MRVVIMLLLCSFNPCLSAPTIIYDSGQTRSLMGYTVSVTTANRPRKTLPTRAMPSVYPVITKALTPGVVKASATKQPHLQQPLFVVGYDSLSLRWLKTFHATLLKHQAVGLVVNIDNAQQLETLKAAAPGLEIYPGPGTQLAQEIGLTQYPALISNNRIEQ